MKTITLFFALTLVSLTSLSRANGSLENLIIESEALTGNVLDINPQREILVYLPSSYSHTNKRYPVLYYFHNWNWSNTQLFGEGNHFKTILDDAIKRGHIDEVIVVAGDFTAPRLGSFFSNYKASGRWLDHITEELIPTVDQQYRTQANAQGRLFAGDFIGGYAAIKLAMLYPNLTSAVYAMHPVATDTGETLMLSRPDWRAMNTARDWEALNGNIYSFVFMLMAQAYLPNPDRPPFFADLMVDLKDDKLVTNTQNVRALRHSFLLADQLAKHADALKQLHAFKMDWGRHDANPDHVYANQKFTRLLTDYGIDHEAEEFNGGPFDRYWGDKGRITSEFIPFISEWLNHHN